MLTSQTGFRARGGKPEPVWPPLSDLLSYSSQSRALLLSISTTLLASLFHLGPRWAFKSQMSAASAPARQVMNMKWFRGTVGKIQADAVSLSPAQTPLSQAEQGWARLLQQNLDTLYGSLMLPETQAAINQDMQQLQDHPGGQVKTQTAGTRQVRQKRPKVKDHNATVCNMADFGAGYTATKRTHGSFTQRTSCSLTLGSSEKYSSQIHANRFKPCHNCVLSLKTLLELHFTSFTQFI